jgi:hypothetical protein
MDLLTLAFVSLFSLFLPLTLTRTVLNHCFPSPFYSSFFAADSFQNDPQNNSISSISSLLVFSACARHRLSICISNSLSGLRRHRHFLFDGVE